VVTADQLLEAKLMKKGIEGQLISQFGDMSGRGKRHYGLAKSSDRVYGVASLTSDNIQNVINNDFQRDYLRNRVIV
jgi:hypothetical protein